MKKLREEREQFFEYQQLDRELEKMLGLFQCWQYCQARHVVKNTNENLENAKKKIQGFEGNIEENIQAAKSLDHEIEEMSKNTQSVITVFKFQKNGSPHIS